MRFRRGARVDTSQVTDLRGQGGGRAMRRGGVAAGGGGLIGLIVVLILVFTGGGGGLGGLAPLEGQEVGSPQAGGGGPAETECRDVTEATEQRDDCRLVFVISSIQSYWSQAFQGSGLNYQPVDTVFFDGEVNTACGVASAAVGPFYCPGDKLVYIDLGFFDTLQEDFGAREDRSPRRTSSRTSTDITCRTSSACSSRPAATGKGPRAFPCGPSSRPTATPASGRPMRSPRAP